MKALPSLIFLVLSLALAGCSENPLAVNNSSGETVAGVDVRLGKVLHFVSVGSPDACEAIGAAPGCDGNFSLVAMEREAGSVSGQWQDTFAGGGYSSHVEIDCINVVGNTAIVGGLITKGSYPGVGELTGRAVTAVVDNGISASDPPDQLSFTLAQPWLGLFVDTDDCQELTIADFAGILLDVPQGQVTVR